VVVEVEGKAHPWLKAAVVAEVHLYLAGAGLAVRLMGRVALVELMVVAVVVVVCKPAVELEAQEPQAWSFLNGDKYESTYSK
jgi:hypothetical protein